MKTKIIELVNGGKRRAFNLIRNDSEMTSYLENLYPGYPVSDQIYFCVNGLEKAPFCQICGGILSKPKTAKTCSVKCRDIYKKQNGSFQEARIKAKTTLIERYGCENPMASVEIQAKRKKTMLSKYGGMVSEHHRSIASERMSKLNESGYVQSVLYERYGVVNPGQLPEHHERIKESMVSRYGVDHFTKTDEWRTDQRIRRKEFWQQYTGDQIDVIDVIPGTEQLPNERILQKCKNCNDEYTIPHETHKWRMKRLGTTCRRCSGLSSGSLFQNDVLAFVNGVLLVETSVNDRSILDGLEIDIYDHEMKTGIECNGSFWHSTERLGSFYHFKKSNISHIKNISILHISDILWYSYPLLARGMIEWQMGKYTSLSSDIDVECVNVYDGVPGFINYEYCILLKTSIGVAAIACVQEYNDEVHVVGIYRNSGPYAIDVIDILSDSIPYETALYIHADRMIPVISDTLKSHGRYKHLYTTLPAPRYLVDYMQYSTEATDQCYYDSGYDVWVRRHV